MWVAMGDPTGSEPTPEERFATSDWTAYLKERPPRGLEFIGRLPGAIGPVMALRFSPDGRRIAATASGSFSVWDVATGQRLLQIHPFAALAQVVADPVAGDRSSPSAVDGAHRELSFVSRFVRFSWSPDGRRILYVESDRVAILDPDTGEQGPSIVLGHLRAAEWSPRGDVVAVGTVAGPVLILSADDLGVVRRLTDHRSDVQELAWSPNGRYLASGGGSSEGNSRDGKYDQGIRVWDTQSGRRAATLVGHTGFIAGLAWSPGSDLLASVSVDRTVRVWDPRSGDSVHTIEVHNEGTRGVAFSPDGRVLVSASWDKSVRFWDPDDGRPQAAMYLRTNDDQVETPVRFTADGTRFAIGRADEILLFRADPAAIAGGVSDLETVRYTTAKLVLVGDSGVGKTGLGWRLSHDEFREHASTHGQQFWLVDSLSQVRPDGTECQAVIWDLAGQHVYRPVHVIFLERVDLAILMFDPTNRHESLKGVEFWLEQLAGRGPLPPTVLVGGRLDRGSPVLSRPDLSRLCERRGVAGGYIGTSAKTGEGVDDLLDVLRKLIPWDRAAATVTTVTFKRIKDYVLGLKEEAATGRVLVDTDQLFQELTAMDRRWRVTVEEMLTAVGHLENHGYVAMLTSSAGQRLVLLVPTLLPDLASSIILLADRHPWELGALNETMLLGGGYSFPELADLNPAEREVLVDATVARFLRHNVCFRETLGAETLLIFPSLSRQRRPLEDDEQTVDDVSYRVQGRVENSYAAIAVLIGYAQVFTRVTQWQHQTQYEIQPSQICGLRMIQDREGELEFVLSYSAGTPSYGRALFQGLFEKFLLQRDVKVTRFTPVACSEGHRQERAVVVQRQSRGFLFCSECGAKVALSNAEPVGRPDAGVLPGVVRQESYARLRSEYEANLVRVKAFTRNAAVRRCYVSHAGDRAQWVDELLQSLRDAGIALLDRPDELRGTDTVLMACTPTYWRAWAEPAGLVERDVSMLGRRLRRGGQAPIIPLLVEGAPSPDQLARLGGREVRDFRDESRYVIALFDLVLELHAIPRDSPVFTALRRAMVDRWREAVRVERELPPPAAVPGPRVVFLSYAWNDESEAVAAELVQAFQQHGVRVVQDTHDLGFKGDIREFMREIGRGRAVLIILSDKYLRSENCMFELLEIARHGDLRDRVFPVVLDSARIYRPVDRIRYVRYWEEQIAELDGELKTVSAANLDGFRQEIDLFTAIRAALPRLGDILKNINALTPAVHRESGYAEVVEAVLRELAAERSDAAPA
jgi:small GTP-binding protein